MKTRLQAWGSSKVIAIACCAILNERGEVLLLQRHSDDLGGGLWCLPGGRMDAGEQPYETALREVQEETGLTLGDIRLLGEHEVRMPHGAVHMTSFRAHVSDDAAIVLDPEEHEAYKWLAPSLMAKHPAILWGVPTVLRDFDLVVELPTDPTLSDGSSVLLLHKAA
jgi:8-oxo-dGTP diphosphatase